jgi:hypothetical protein
VCSWPPDDVGDLVEEVADGDALVLAMPSWQIRRAIRLAVASGAHLAGVPCWLSLLRSTPFTLWRTVHAWRRRSTSDGWHVCRQVPLASPESRAAHALLVSG